QPEETNVEGPSFTQSSLSGDGRLLAFEAERAIAGSLPDAPVVKEVFVRDVGGPHRVDPDLEADGAADLTGNGIVGETVLQVIDTTPETETLFPRSCPAREVAVSSGRAVFLRPEAAGHAGGCPDGSHTPGDLNDDGDTDDDVVQLWTRHGVQNLGVAATEVAISK